MTYTLLSGNYPCRSGAGRMPKAGYHDFFFFFFYGGQAPLLGMAELSTERGPQNSMDRSY
jgi:hypothetical protein